MLRRAANTRRRAPAPKAGRVVEMCWAKSEREAARLQAEGWRADPRQPISHHHHYALLLTREVRG